MCVCRVQTMQDAVPAALTTECELWTANCVECNCYCCRCLLQATATVNVLHTLRRQANGTNGTRETLCALSATCSFECSGTGQKLRESEEEYERERQCVCVAMCVGVYMSGRATPVCVCEPNIELDENLIEFTILTRVLRGHTIQYLAHYEVRVVSLASGGWKNPHTHIPLRVCLYPLFTYS